MKLINKIALGLAVTALSCVTTAEAGNKDRTGQAGAYELLINPYARSGGWSEVVSNGQPLFINNKCEAWIESVAR